MALSENAAKVLAFVSEKQTAGKAITADDIAAGTGLTTRQVNGVITGAFQRKKLMERIPAEVELEDGSHKPVKLIQLTPAGLEHDFDAE